MHRLPAAPHFLCRPADAARVAHSTTSAAAAASCPAPLAESAQQVRHKPFASLKNGPRPLILATSHLHSNVNFSQIARIASCCGVTRILSCGVGNKFLAEIARESSSQLQITVKNSLEPTLRELRKTHRLVGLEQSTKSTCLYDYRYRRESVLVVGNEKSGLSQSILDLMDDVVEIPIHAMPYSHNVAAATAMALYEYCRQFPDG